jgi:dihydrofolate reductase
MANIVYLACSMDGFIAKEGGDINWLNEIPNETNSDYGFHEFMDRIDGVIMGRNTFEKLLEFNLPEWPYNKPVFVLSTTLKKIPENLKNKVEIVNGKLKNILKNLEDKNINNIYVDGGKTIQSFLKENLIDEMIINTVSIILGMGIPLFGKENNMEIKFIIEKTEYLNKYMVKNYYKRI